MNRLKTYYLVSIMLLGLAFSCSGPKNEPDPKQYILSKHDELMQKGEVAMSIKMQLDTLQLIHSTAVNPQIDTLKSVQQIKAIRASLIKADETMEDWMHQYKADYEGNSAEATNAYYQAEADKLNKLDGLYNNAISEAKGLFQKLHIPPINKIDN